MALHTSYVPFTLTLLGAATHAVAVPSTPLGGFKVYRLRCDGSNLLESTAATAFSIDNPQPRFTWAASHPERGQRQMAYRVVVKLYNTSRSRHKKEDNIDFSSLRTLWDSGRVVSAEPSHSFAVTTAVDAAGARAAVAAVDNLQSDTYYAWSVTLWDSEGRPSDTAVLASFHVALLHQDDWTGVGWVAGNSKMNHNMLRATFRSPEPAAVHSATIFVCGLSYSFVRMNGRPASSHLLTTAPWTNNEVRNGYSALDVTHLLQEGNNAVGVVLGHGWRDQRPDYTHGGEPMFKRKDPAFAAETAAERILRLQLRLRLSNGTSITALHTGDGSWKATAGPYMDDATYNGETYDAREEHPGWDTAAFHDDREPGVATRLQTTAGWEHTGEATPLPARSWRTAIPTQGPAGRMSVWSAPAVLEDRLIKPVSVSTSAPSTNGSSKVFLVDFGVNVAGVCRLRNIKIRAGAAVTLRHAEILQHPGLPDLNGTVDSRRIYVGNLRGAKATDVYIAKGAGEVGETYQPMLTYHQYPKYLSVS